MRILYYNWVDYLDGEERGGGVSVYQRNLIEALDARGGVETRFLSAGISHDLLARRPRWERVRHGPERDRHRRFEIVNSAVLAPAHLAFGNPAQIADPATEAVFADFVARTGPYDVVHFNNLEGLPARVLAHLKTRWPETRVILSLHNYYAFCPQVNLWHRESTACTGFDSGRRCTGCLEHRHDERLVRLAHAVAFTLKKRGIRPGTPAFDRVFRPSMGIAARLARAAGRMTREMRRRGARPEASRDVSLADGAPFVARRAAMVGLINAHCDRVQCVSARTAEIAAQYGIAPELLRAGHIGTRQAERFRETRPRPALLRPDGTLQMAYLGYMRRDKGFHFLLDALEALPDARAARLRLLVAARRRDAATKGRLDALGRRLAGLRHVDGYTHDALDALLADVDLGVVPVLWEDNLPQVAIEMHARHIPVLTSDMGGARELANCPDLVFAAGSVESLHERLGAILDGKVTAAACWQGAAAPVPMDAHLERLLADYAAPPRLPPDLRPEPPPEMPSR